MTTNTMPTWAGTGTPVSSATTALATVASQINQHHKLACTLAGQAVSHAIEAGKLLLSVKESLPHGGFGDWMANNLDVTDRTARRYMAAALGKPLPIRAIQSDRLPFAIESPKTDTVSDLKNTPAAKQRDNEATIDDDTEQVVPDAVRYYRTTGTGENEWYTPGEYVDLAREVMGGIDLDPASCDEANEVVKADKYFTKEISGLAEKWSGRIWLNPPYSRDLMPAFIAKIKESYLGGEVDQAVILTHNNTDTTWFHSLVGIADSLCFSKKRIKFYRGDDEPASPTNGQAFFYLGRNVDRFNEVFAAIGFIVAPVKGVAA